MKKENAFIKIWEIIYPILIYYVVSNIVMALVLWAMGITDENYGEKYTMMQTIATVVVIPVLIRFYQKDSELMNLFHQRTNMARKEMPMKKQILYLLASLVCGTLAGIALNNVIAVTGLMGVSKGYQDVTTQFYAGSLWVELIGIGILIPFVEELLYRGIVYGRLSDWVGIKKAAVFSALIFGALHLNLVQFLYAFVFGFLLVFLLEKTHNLYGAVLAHIGANMITILRTECGVLDWMNKNAVVFWGSTIFMAAVVIWIILCMKKRA